MKRKKLYKFGIVLAMAAVLGTSPIISNAQEPDEISKETEIVTEEAVTEETVMDEVVTDEVLIDDMSDEVLAEDIAIAGEAVPESEYAVLAASALNITVQPKDVALTSGTAKFSVTAEGDGLTYQWYWRKNASAEWGVCGFTGSKTNTVSVEAIAARNGYEYSCIIKDKYGNQVQSNAAVLTTVVSAAKITVQPKDVALTSGTAKFSVTAEGDGLTYQWYWRKNASAEWGVCGFAGSKTNTLSVDAIAARNGFEYSCIVKDRYGNQVQSNTAVLTTVATPVKITVQPKDVVLTSGTAKLSVTAEGDGLTYQWYWRKNASAEWSVCGFTGSKTNMVSVEAIAARNGFEYSCIVKDKYGNQVRSNTAVLTTVGKTVKIIDQPEDVVLTSGTAKFSVTAEGDGLTYQWYWRKNASAEWGACGFIGSKTNTVSVDAIAARNGFEYSCIVKDKYGNSVRSNTAVLTTVKNDAKITVQPNNVILPSGTAKFSVTAEGDGLTYQWYWRRNSSYSWAECNFTGGKTNTLSVEAILARNGFEYSCIVKDKYGNSVQSDAAVLTTNVKFAKIKTNPLDAVALNGTVKFSVTAEGDGLTYQWYWRRNASSEWSACGFTGSKTNTVSVDVIAARDGFEYSCLIKDKYGNYVRSSAAALSYGVKLIDNSNNEVFYVVKPEQFEEHAGLSSGKVVYIPKGYRKVYNSVNEPVNLQAVVDGSSSSISKIRFFFYLEDGESVYYID